jgi:hypothetical protein
MFKIQRRTAILRAEYPSPLFQAFTEVWPLQQAIYQVLAPHGVSASDVRVERRNGDPTLTCNVLSLGMVVSLRLTHLEVFVMHPGEDPIRPALISELLDRLSAAVGGFVLFTLGIDDHGILEGSTPTELIGRFVKPPDSRLGAPQSSSVAFYYGPSETRAVTSIHLEPSSLVSDGLFVKTTCVWKADGLDLATMISDARAVVADTLEALGLGARRVQEAKTR